MKYEITGVIEYAHCVSFEIEAENEEEARRKALLKVEEYINPSNAEFTEFKIDKPVEIQEEKLEADAMRAILKRADKIKW